MLHGQASISFIGFAAALCIGLPAHGSLGSAATQQDLQENGFAVALRITKNGQMGECGGSHIGGGVVISNNHCCKDGKCEPPTAYIIRKPGERPTAVRCQKVLGAKEIADVAAFQCDGVASLPKLEVSSQRVPAGAEISLMQFQCADQTGQPGWSSCPEPAKVSKARKPNDQCVPTPAQGADGVTTSVTCDLGGLNACQGSSGTAITTKNPRTGRPMLANLGNSGSGTCGRFRGVPGEMVAQFISEIGRGDLLDGGANKTAGRPMTMAAAGPMSSPITSPALGAAHISGANCGTGPAKSGGVLKSNLSDIQDIANTVQPEPKREDKSERPQVAALDPKPQTDRPAKSDPPKSTSPGREAPAATDDTVGGVQKFVQSVLGT